MNSLDGACSACDGTRAVGGVSDRGRMSEGNLNNEPGRCTDTRFVH